MRIGPERNRRRAGFNLIELLIVIAIMAILAGLLITALGKAKATARRAGCTSNLRQMAILTRLYLDDNEARFPDARDRKASLPGGYRPWSTWPASDPRIGWAPPVLDPGSASSDIWTCPGVKRSSLSRFDQCTQSVSSDKRALRTHFWMWRFDRIDEEIPLDNFWGKTETQAIADLVKADNPFIGVPRGPSEVEMTVDVYFPATIGSVDPSLKGRAAHANGRNRLMLDGHVQFLKDKRTGKY